MLSCLRLSDRCLKYLVQALVSMADSISLEIPTTVPLKAWWSHRQMSATCSALTVMPSDVPAASNYPGEGHTSVYDGVGIVANTTTQSLYRVPKPVEYEAVYTGAASTEHPFTYQDEDGTHIQLLKTQSEASRGKILRIY